MRAHQLNEQRKWSHILKRASDVPFRHADHKQALSLSNAARSSEKQDVSRASLRLTHTCRWTLDKHEPSCAILLTKTYISRELTFSVSLCGSKKNKSTKSMFSGSLEVLSSPGKIPQKDQKQTWVRSSFNMNDSIQSFRDEWWFKSTMFSFSYLDAVNICLEFVQMALMGLSWPRTSPMGVKLSTFHTFSMPPRQALSSIGRPGTYARAHTQSLWALGICCGVRVSKTRNQTERQTDITPHVYTWYFNMKRKMWVHSWAIRSIWAG